MNINVKEIMRRPVPLYQASIVVAASSVLAATIGYLLGKREPSPLPPRHREELEEIKASMEEIKARRAAKVVIDEDELRRRAAEAVPVEPVEEEEEKIIAIIDRSESEPDVVIRNVFAEAAVDDDWDYEVEVRNRTSTEPYILHKDEFYADEMGFTQHTYTYYEGDDILADEDDKPVYNHAGIVGELRFGHGSGDAKVVHIRNEKRKEEYEVVKEAGLFSVEVLGLNIEDNERAKGLEHSAPKRFRLQE